MAMRLDAEDVLELAGRDQDARGGDEARDHRMAEEIREKAQPAAHRSRMPPDRKASVSAATA
jgi:hypothetical protein